MSAGAFLTTRYQSDEGGIYGIRVQPETVDLTIAGQTNNPPTGAVDQEGLARVSGGRRRIGIKARNVRFRFSGTPPTGYEEIGVLTLPCLTAAFYNNIPRSGGTGTYLGASIAVVGKSPQGGR